MRGSREPKDTRHFMQALTFDPLLLILSSAFVHRVPTPRRLTVRASSSSPVSSHDLPAGRSTGGLGTHFFSRMRVFGAVAGGGGGEGVLLGFPSVLLDDGVLPFSMCCCLFRCFEEVWQVL